MTADNATAGDGQDSTDAESILRGSFDKLGVCEFEVEESTSPGLLARLVLRGDDNLARVTVDLTPEDVARLRQELAGLADG
jgi:hypothetical protein